MRGTARRDGIGHGADELCDFLVAEPDRERGARPLRDSQDAVIEVGFRVEI
jgi:hypothetical protein